MTTASRRGVTVLSWIGLLICAITIFNELTEFKQSTLCTISPTFDCAKVAASKYSLFLGVPLSVWGAVYYVFLILFATAMPSVVAALSVVAVLASISLFYLSSTVIGALCPLCMAQYAVNLLLCVFAQVGGISLRSLVPEIAGNLFGRRTMVFVIAILALLGGVLPLHPKTKGYFLKTNSSASSGEAAITAVVSRWEKMVAKEIPVTVSGDRSDQIKGNPAAKVTIVEFLDFECPACRMVAAELTPLFERYKDSVRVVFKHYPLDQACNAGIPEPLHKNACFSAEVALCMGEQGKFWQAADALLALPLDGEGAVFQAGILNQVKSLTEGDFSRLTDCISSGRQKQMVTDDIALGDKLAIEGTPTVFINGKQVPVPSAVVVEKILKKLLAE